MSEAVAERITRTFERSSASPSEAFEALYRRAFPRVYGYVATLMRDRAAAEEVTAQAFERAFRKRRSFRASRGTEEAWLFGIARNAALDELRRRKRRAVLEAEPEDVHAPSADEQVDGTLRRETVRGALGRLTPRERELVGAQVRRRPVARGDRPRARHLRIERGHAPAPDDREAEEGMR